MTLLANLSRKTILFDFAGKPVPQNNFVDIGAYEFRSLNDIDNDTIPDSTDN
jgi:hypothetical protein